MVREVPEAGESGTGVIRVLTTILEIRSASSEAFRIVTNWAVIKTKWLIERRNSRLLIRGPRENDLRDYCNGSSNAFFECSSPNFRIR